MMKDTVCNEQFGASGAVTLQKVQLSCGDVFSLQNRIYFMKYSEIFFMYQNFY